ncbi:MAG: hypothetical protein ABIW17_04515 [Marmoricola sp.]
MKTWKAPLAVLLAGTLTLVGCGGASSTSPAMTPAPSQHETGAPAPASTRVFRATSAHGAYAGWRLRFPVARSAVTAVGGDPRHTLMAGGMLPGDSSTDRVSQLDPTTGRTTPGPPLSIPVHDAAAGSFAGRPAVYGGGNTTEQSAVQELRDGRWQQVARLPTTRSDLSVATVGARTLVIGGYDGANVALSILTQRGHGLTPHGSLRHGVRYAATAVVGHSIYVFGGEVDHRELVTVQRIDAPTGRTTVVGRLPRPLGHAMAAYVGGRVLLMGGRTDPETQSDAMWWFDPADGRFTRAGRLPDPVSDGSVVTLGRRIWILGGQDPDVTNRVVLVKVS